MSEDKKSGCSTIVTDIVLTFMICVILEICGCHVFECIGSVAGKISNGYSNGYKATVREIHPSDCR